jgi:hypothetical protein
MDFKSLLFLFVAIVSMASVTVPAAARPWSRGFVISSYEYAFRYGGRPGGVNLGVDCPRGSTDHFASPAQIDAVLRRQKWRSPQEVDWVSSPPGVDQALVPGEARKGIWGRAISYRGYKRGIETYINPWAAEDTGQHEVTSSIAEGFNLDGKIGPRDFVSTDGEKGIDNALYRAWGCVAPLRGNPAFWLEFANDKMRAGLYTMVIRISGNQDPLNDKDATLEIGYSPDKIVLDARGAVAQDYSYRILTSGLYTKLRATVKNGIVESEQVDHLHTPRIANFYDHIGDTNFMHGRIRLNISLNGLNGIGVIGGYRSWRDVYAESIVNFFTSAGSMDIIFHDDHVARYYALRRNADGMYNKKTGEYDGISAAYRVKLVSAFVVDSQEQMEIPKLIRDAKSIRMRKVTEEVKDHTLKGMAARIPQAVPPSSGEAYYPTLEVKAAKGLPSRDYFLRTLDRPHYPNGVNINDENFATDDQGNPIGKQRTWLDELGHQ